MLVSDSGPAHVLFLAIVTRTYSTPKPPVGNLWLSRSKAPGGQQTTCPEPLGYQKHDLEQELDLVAVTRRQMACTLRLVTPDAWQRTAVHSETGLVTLRQLLLHAINHLRHHLRFVAEKRAAMGSAPQ